MRAVGGLLVAGALAVAVLGGCADGDPAGGSTLLVVDLQEGFAGEPGGVRADGRSIAVEAATTNEMTGFAATVELTTEPGPVLLRIDIGEGRLAVEREIEVEADTFVGVNVEGGTPTLFFSDEPFGYG